MQKREIFRSKLEEMEETKDRFGEKVEHSVEDHLGRRGNHIATVAEAPGLLGFEKGDQYKIRSFKQTRL